MAREDIWWIGYIHQQAFRRGSGNIPVDTVMQKGKAIPEQTAIGLSNCVPKEKFFFILVIPYCNFEINFNQTESMNALVKKKSQLD